MSNAALLLSRRRRGAFGGKFSRYLAGSALAYLTAIAAKPVFDDPSLALYVNVDDKGLWAYKGFQGGDAVEELYADPNAIPGLLNEATGPARPFIGASGKYEIALSNPVPRQDMSGGAAFGAGNAVGGYQKVSSLTTTDDRLAFDAAEPVTAGDRVELECEVKGTAGQTATFRVSRSGATSDELAEYRHTFSGDWELLPALSHVFANTHTGWRVIMGRVGAADTATEFEIRNVWARRTLGGGGQWPMQNLGGFTYDTLPEHLSQRWGVGVEYDPDTLKPLKLVTGDEYENAVPFEELTGNTVWGASGTNEGLTATLVERYIDTNGALVVVYDYAGTLTASNASGGMLTAITRTAAATGETWTTSIDARLVSGVSPTDGVSLDVVEETAPSTYLTNARTPVDGFRALTAEWDTFVVTKTLENGATDQTRTGIRINGATSEVIACRIAYRYGQLAKSAVQLPYMPHIPDGQSVSAAQKLRIDANKFMPLGPNVYTPQGQSGAIDNSDTNGVEQFTNGTFDSDSDFTKGTGWSIGSGIATCDGSQSGTSGLSQSGVVTGGQAGVLTLDVTRSAGAYSIWLGGRNVRPIGNPISGTLSIGNVPVNSSEFAFLADADFVGTVDNVSFQALTVPWFSDTGEGRFSLDGNVLTLATGSAAETVSLLAAPLGLADGDVVEVEVLLERTAGTIQFRNPAGVSQAALSASSTATRTVNHQFTVSGGIVCQCRADDAAAAGTITVNGVLQSQSSEATLYVDRTAREIGVLQAAASLHKDSTSDAEQFLTLRQTSGNALEANTTVASTGDASTLDATVAIGDRQRLVASRTADTMTGKAQDVAAPASNSVGAVDDFAVLRIGTNGWSAGDADAGDIHSFAVFSRALTAAEHIEVVD